jgi:hypothetical protein
MRCCLPPPTPRPRGSGDTGYYYCYCYCYVCCCSARGQVCAQRGDRVLRALPVDLRERRYHHPRLRPDHQRAISVGQTSARQTSVRPACVTGVRHRHLRVEIVEVQRVLQVHARHGLLGRRLVAGEVIAQVRPGLLGLPTREVVSIAHPQNCVTRTDAA